MLKCVYKTPPVRKQRADLFAKCFCRENWMFIPLSRGNEASDLKTSLFSPENLRFIPLRKPHLCSALWRKTKPFGGSFLENEMFIT